MVFETVFIVFLIMILFYYWWLFCIQVLCYQPHFDSEYRFFKKKKKKKKKKKGHSESKWVISQTRDPEINNFSLFNTNQSWEKRDSIKSTALFFLFFYFFPARRNMTRDSGPWWITSIELWFLSDMTRFLIFHINSWDWGQKIYKIL